MFGGVCGLGFELRAGSLWSGPGLQQTVALFITGIIIALIHNAVPVESRYASWETSWQMWMQPACIHIRKLYAKPRTRSHITLTNSHTATPITIRSYNGDISLGVSGGKNPWVSRPESRLHTVYARRDTRTPQVFNRTYLWSKIPETL